MNSEEFLKEAREIQSGVDKGKWGITLHSTYKNKESGKIEVSCKQQFNKYVTKDFSRFTKGGSKGR